MSPVDVAGICSKYRSSIHFTFSTSTTLADRLQIFTSPVAYLTDQEFQVEFDKITDNIESNIQFVRAQGSASIENYVFRMFAFAAVSVKIPCFREEREWRLLYAPDIYKSEGVIASSESIGGVPQPVFSIPLVDIPELDFVSQFERIMIGPTQYPAAVGQTFITELERLGVTDAREKIKFRISLCVLNALLNALHSAKFPVCVSNGHAPLFLSRRTHQGMQSLPPQIHLSVALALRIVQPAMHQARYEKRISRHHELSL